MISKELERGAPEVIPYGVMAGLAENSYSSRTLCQEVSEVIIRLTKNDSLDDFRSAIYLLWANRNRISTTEAVNLSDSILDQMSRLEKIGVLLLIDKALGYLLLETVVEDDKKRQRAIERRFKRLLKAQPRAIKKILSG